MKVVVGFSGGVDSAVTAALLKRQGYAVHGLYLDNAGPAECEDAIRTAEAVGIPLAVRDIKRELEEQVCKPFTDCYLRGETPNPCILCNPAVKFRNLLEEADALGAEWVATGHYARAENGALYKGRPANDQSYMLCRLTREQLQRLLLPLGGYEKQQVRALAEELALPLHPRQRLYRLTGQPHGPAPGRGASVSRAGDRPSPGHLSLYRGPALAWSVGRPQGLCLEDRRSGQLRGTGAVGRAVPDRGDGAGLSLAD